ncbi:Protein kinase domain-containing protein [Psidium guajava]|nr:Protein kinase domain-containing protein [Psidium guajava]
MGNWRSDPSLIEVDLHSLVIATVTMVFGLTDASSKEHGENIEQRGHNPPISETSRVMVLVREFEGGQGHLGGGWKGLR